MYTKENFIGGGAFGKVFTAKSNSGELYALKELDLSQYASNAALADNIARRFKQEAITQAEIHHDNVIKIIFSDMGATPPYFVMELAEKTFEKVIQDFQSGLDDISMIRRGLFDILSGLNALHELGIWHRDLKPQNVLYVKGEDKFSISDFGLVAVRDSDATTLTMTGTTGGSPPYAPPEFMQDFKTASAVSDIYSFGAILHDIFVSRKRVPYSELKDGIGKMGEVIQKCTKTKKYHRYQSIEELRADLYEALNEIEQKGISQIQTIDLEIFTKPTLAETDCDLIIDMIDNAAAPQLLEMIRAITIDFIDRAYSASTEAADYIAAKYATYIIEHSFDFGYCDILADRLVHFFTKGSIGTKSICLLAMLKLGTSHNRWYVENRFVKYAGPSCSDQIAKRFMIDAKINSIDLKKVFALLILSISVKSEQLHPQFSSFVV